MTYRTIHTTYGLRAMAQAEASGVPINLTHIAVGDGNGVQIEPSDAQTQLVRERYRAVVNRVFNDQSDPLKFSAEMIIPATEGGFTLREVGVFDSQGGMFAVGNLPDTYKPQASEGAYSDTVVRIEFMVGNTSVVTLQIDPNVAVATQTWISSNITAATLIPGGTTGQLLKKASNADGDTTWGDPDDLNVVVDMIEDKQLLSAGQTQVDLVSTITRGLAVYINGVRINKGSGLDEWLKNPADIDTSIILGQSYAAGTKILCTQNEPTGSTPMPLERSKNLSDVENKSAARENLDIYSKTETDQKAPPGMVSAFAMSSVPSGWMKANGAAVSRTAYANLFAAIGTTFGAGDGFNTFNLPDLRGEFIRGWDDARGIDGGRAFGSWQKGTLVCGYDNDDYYLQASVLPGPASKYGGDPASDVSYGLQDIKYWGQDIPSKQSISTINNWLTIARPRNVAMLYCIKY